MNPSPAALRTDPAPNLSSPSSRTQDNRLRTESGSQPSRDFAAWLRSFASSGPATSGTEVPGSTATQASALPVDHPSPQHSAISRGRSTRLGVGTRAVGRDPGTPGMTCSVPEAGAEESPSPMRWESSKARGSGSGSSLVNRPVSNGSPSTDGAVDPAFLAWAGSSPPVATAPVTSPSARSLSPESPQTASEAGTPAEPGTPRGEGDGT